MVIELLIKKKKWYLLCVYKNPKVPNCIFINIISKMYEKLVSTSSEIVLLGDVNIDLLKRNNVFDEEICDVYDVKNIIEGPTCFKTY